ncbi:hypothetical protein QJS10_CPB15g01193 [Acorus calamus]|uniref:Reverse transcriptase domain-containing protein n=1 Tax=Acorus calamus TaxID=4465 RepID=A0AAV9DCB8_ACOCL|nr:hypothetical protein QJS10_CPB15g01193 [Acorus calamus]
MPIVQNAWELEVKGTAMFRLVSKLKQVKAALKQWYREEVGPMQHNLERQRFFLEEVQKKLQGDPLNQQLLHIESEARREYKNTLTSEESMIRQKSRQNWLKLGDSNSAFFYASFASRKAHNTLRKVTLQNGSQSENPDTVKSFTVDFFKRLLNQRTHKKPSRMDFLTKLSNHEVALLIEEVSEKEIYVTLKSMKASSSPGPDGFNAFFFQACWPVVGADVVLAEANADSLDKFRPISLCGTIYKLITKIMASRLQVVLPKLISLNQTAFIKGRKISQGILLAHELVRYLSHGGLAQQAAIKVDLQKAFDSIQWQFVYEVLHGMHFPKRWVEWIKECIETPCFSVLINGSPEGFFKSSCGLRQGDPLSPLLFVLVMEAFSQSLEAAISNNQIGSYLKIQTHVSHLLFADDLLVFSNGSLQSAQAIKNLFGDFASRSGLIINPCKSQVFLSRSFANAGDFLNIIGIPDGTLPVRYMGLPLIDKPLTHSLCSPLIDKHKLSLCRQIIENVSLTLKDKILVEDLTPSMEKLSQAWGVVISQKQTTRQLIRWTPPNLGWLKSNSDGALSPDRAGYGTILRNLQTIKDAADVAIATMLSGIQGFEIKKKGMMEGRKQRIQGEFFRFGTKKKKKGGKRNRFKTYGEREREGLFGYKGPSHGAATRE